ncbi:M48 family metalloprotease [Micromonospora sp. MS34]|uniref:M48 family metalloprotease n=1 Tax=Micromonospora sp. MS34 TaxID=3385971 RepID=UPI0039A2E5C0
MITAAVLAAAAWLVSAVTAPWLVRSLPPATATRLLVLTSAAVTGGGALLGMLLAVPWLAQQPVLGRFGPWSTAALRSGDPVPAWVSAILSVAVLGCLTGAVAHAVRRVRAIAAIRRACAGLADDDGLVVLPAERPEAFSTPPPAGLVVLSTGLLERVPAEELTVVLAHERSHLAHGHVWYALAADLAAAGNPLLAPTARAVRHAVERWADEDAAAHVADRRLAARALARTALLTGPTAAAPATLGAADSQVAQRVAALLTGAPRRRTLPAVILLVLLLAGAGAAGLTERRTDDLLDHAHAPAAVNHRAGHGENRAAR